MSDRYASDFPEVRFAHLFITVVSLTNKLFQRMWSDSQKGLNALHTTVIAPSLLSVIATVTCTKAKLERIMGSWLLCLPQICLARDRMHFHQVRSPTSQLTVTHLLCPHHQILRQYHHLLEDRPSVNKSRHSKISYPPTSSLPPLYFPKRPWVP